MFRNVFWTQTWKISLEYPIQAKPNRTQPNQIKPTPIQAWFKTCQIKFLKNSKTRENNQNHSAKLKNGEFRAKVSGMRKQVCAFISRKFASAGNSNIFAKNTFSKWLSNIITDYFNQVLRRECIVLHTLNSCSFQVFGPNFQKL